MLRTRDGRGGGLDAELDSYKLQGFLCLCTKRSLSPAIAGDQDRRQLKELRRWHSDTRHPLVRLFTHPALATAKVTPDQNGQASSSRRENDMNEANKEAAILDLTSGALLCCRVLRCI